MIFLNQFRYVVPIVILFRYLILLRIHKNKRILINKLKQTASFHDEVDELKINRSRIFINNFLKIVSSPWSTLIFPPLFTVFYCLLNLFIYGYYSFECYESTYTAMRILYITVTAILYVIVIFLILIDGILNIQLIFNCRCKKIFVDDDPFNFRPDMIGVLAVIIPSAIWTAVPLPKYIYAVITEFTLFCAPWLMGWQALVITIFKKFILYLRKNKDIKKKIYLEYCISNEIIEIFIQFCELEWSVENILFKLDVRKYLNSKSNSERKKICQVISTKYITPDVSQLEINCPVPLMVSAIKKIEKEEFDDDLFVDIEKVVDGNLCDTISRFQFSSLYNSYLKQLENQKKELGL